MQDERNQKRAELDTVVRLRTPNAADFIEQHTNDISTGGLFVRSDAPLPKTTLVKIEVDVDGQLVAKAVGRVVWMRTAEDATPETPAGMGIKFVRLDAASEAKIAEIVAQRGDDGPSTFERAEAAGKADANGTAAASSTEPEGEPAPEADGGGGSDSHPAVQPSSSLGATEVERPTAEADLGAAEGSASDAPSALEEPPSDEQKEQPAASPDREAEKEQAQEPPPAEQQEQPAASSEREAEKEQAQEPPPAEQQEQPAASSEREAEKEQAQEPPDEQQEQPAASSEREAERRSESNGAAPDAQAAAPATDATERGQAPPRGKKKGGKKKKRKKERMAEARARRLEKREARAGSQPKTAQPKTAQPKAAQPKSKAPEPAARASKPKKNEAQSAPKPARSESKREAAAEKTPDESPATLGASFWPLVVVLIAVAAITAYLLWPQ